MNAGDKLLADIGGTNARFAWQAHRSDTLDQVVNLRCADHPSLADAMTAYLRQIQRPAPARCCIAIANPVLGDVVKMTNHHWSFSIQGLRTQFGFQQLRVLNDFTALALALPLLQAQELRQISGDSPAPNAAIGLIGPGTGLGVSGLLPNGRGGWVPIEGEGGHVSLAAITPREHAVLAWLAQRHGGHASAERAVCGQGLSDLYSALHALNGVTQPSHLDAAAVVAAALAQSDALAEEALDLFCGFLGTVAGNLALTLGARGGVYIGGGIVPRLGPAFDRSSFKNRFEKRGRFTSYLAAIPVYVIQADPSPALRGASSALDGEALELAPSTAA